VTTKIFWQNPYQTTLETRVTGVNGNDVTAAETIFYALSGGQESDRGTIGGQPVLQARKEGREIVYTMGEGHGLKPGDPVAMTIDWARRYRLMRLHFAAEVILELVYKKLGAVKKVGAHIAEDKARIDFEWGENISALFPALKAEALAIVQGNRAIVSAFSDEANERRYWEIPEFSRVPCGGTHLRRTGEIGVIELKRKNIGKGKERIEVFVGDVAL
jgi:Ser-tRNA(Ala) deacylase AlaX